MLRCPLQNKNAFLQEFKGSARPQENHFEVISKIFIKGGSNGGLSVLEEGWRGQDRFVFCISILYRALQAKARR